jgi:ribosomal-protein-alanine N-acetyltransferase
LSNPGTRGSWKAAEACGFQREGLLRKWERVGDELKDMYVDSVIPARDERAHLPRVEL